MKKIPTKRALLFMANVYCVVTLEDHSEPLGLSTHMYGDGLELGMYEGNTKSFQNRSLDGIY